MKLLILMSPVPGILIIVFTILKFLKIIEWSWLKIFSPLLIAMLFSMVIIFLEIIFMKMYTKSHQKNVE